MTGEILSKYKIYDKAIYFVNTYNTILTSIANSIVNVYWRGEEYWKIKLKNIDHVLVEPFHFLFYHLCCFFDNSRHSSYCRR